MKYKILAIVILLVLLLIILVQNTHEVIFRIFFWTIRISPVILVPLAVLLGFFFGYIIGRADRGRKK